MKAKDSMLETPPAANDSNRTPTLAIVGGGLAGIAAAEAAVRAGFRVDLFEWSRNLGGRAASLFEPVARQWIDNGQHLALGCCTELLDLHRRLGLDRFFERCDSIPFAAVGGKRWTLSACSFLPKALQLGPAFLNVPMPSFGDRLQTGILLRKLGARKRRAGRDDRILPDECFADWMRRHRVSEAAMEQFWTPLILSALSETPENVSREAVRKVVRDGFLAGKEAWALHLPLAPLRTIYHEAASRKLQESGVRLHFHSRVRRLIRSHPEASGAPAETDASRIGALETRDGRHHTFDDYILAIPSHQAWELLDASELGDYADRLALDRFEPGAITSIHLWLDRRLLPTSRPCTALIGGPGQFLFCPARQPFVRFEETEAVYHTVVLSASHRLLTDEELSARGRSALVDRIMRQLRQTFPECFHDTGTGDVPADAPVLHDRVTTFFNAVFSPGPNVYTSRPSGETPFSNLALAGDWTRTHWPSTLEGAVRSGLRAVELLQSRSDR